MESDMRASSPSDDANGQTNDTRDKSQSGSAEITEATRSWRFWLVFVSLCLVSLSVSIDTTIITTSLPTIVRSIGGSTNYIWIGNSFLLASTALQPLVGQLADIFGRRWPIIVSIILFIVGSGIAGGANSVAMLISGRTVQGLGGCGIYVLHDIIISDLVPVHKRGQYLGVALSAAALGSIIGPVLGGVIADTNWRWCFYLTVVTAGVTLVALLLFLRVNVARDSRPAISRIDWIGAVLFTTSITSIMLGLVMGGNNFAWGSYHVIVPLVLGFLGWIGFHAYEMSPLCRNPSVPPRLFSHRTSLIGFLLTFDGSMLQMWAVIFLPIYFQGVKGTNALVSGINLLPLCMFLIPGGILAGALMSKTGKFKPLHWFGFAVAGIGCGLVSVLGANSPKIEWAFFEIIFASGLGFTMTTVLPAIQAPLPEADQAAATATFSFMRSFGFIWGLTLPAIVFNNQFDAHISRISDQNTRESLINGQAYGLVSGDFLKSLTPSIRNEVIEVYTDALKPVWQVGIASALLGFLLVFLEKHVHLRTELDTKYGLQDNPKGRGHDPEVAESQEPESESKN